MVMTISNVTERKGLSARLLVILVLLGISVFINYIDRGNLSIAAAMLKDELGISASQLGILLSAFFRALLLGFRHPDRGGIGRYSFLGLPGWGRRAGGLAPKVSSC